MSILWRSKFDRGGSFFDSYTSLRAFDETLKALRAAVDAVTQLSVFDLTNFEEHDTVQAFGDAESEIKKSFESFGVSLSIFDVSPKILRHNSLTQLSAKWSEKENDRVNALQKDIARTNDLQKVLNRVSRLVIRMG